MPPSPADAQVRARRISINDNREPAGRLRKGLLVLRLEARVGMWHPDGDQAPGVMMPAFAEAGERPEIPGPLIRVPAGTLVNATMRNLLADTLVIHGLGDSMVLAPGAMRQARFQLDVPGTYYYWASTTRSAVDSRFREDAQLGGAIVVDAAGAVPRDRILVLGTWSDELGRMLTLQQRMLAVVNGRSWPHTERLRHATGDTVRWRVINASADRHPMHLHGFYFTVNSRGDGRTDTVYADAQRDSVVTENMLPGATMSLTWIPDRPGNWLFHCHIPEHFAPRGSLGTILQDEHHGNGPVNHALSGMGGLVLGVHVRGPAAEPSAAPRRSLRLLVGADGYALEEDGGARGGPSHRRAPAIVLTRGEPVRITVVNTLSEPTAVHWHGIELESYFDGVAGFSGAGERVSPVIAAADSFEVRFTPPRAGTFIYHTHVNEERQQRAGLAGPLIVLEPGEFFDPAHDLTVLIGAPGQASDDGRMVLINGEREPGPLELVAGERYRLRLINMTTRRPGLRVELRDSAGAVRWRPLAKDAIALAGSRGAVRRALQPLGIGETADVEIVPERDGELRLVMLVGPGAGSVMGWLPVRVRRP